MNLSTTACGFIVTYVVTVIWSGAHAQTACPGGSYSVESALEWCARDQGFNEGAACGAEALGASAPNADLLNRRLSGKFWTRAEMMSAAREAAKNGYVEQAVEGAICCQIQSPEVSSCLRRNSLAVARWLDPEVNPMALSASRKADRSLVGRFADSVYYTLSAIAWTPGSNEAGKYRPVRVPAGFVFTFDSVPRLYWAVVRPDAEFVLPVVIHDYLYWTQQFPRAESDEIFRLAMLDLSMNPTTVQALYSGVRAGGQAAWDDYARRKRSGEKRILKVFPEAANVTWETWRRRPDVFVDSAR
jgi:hypothetical protein